jgi:hypothetical protein
MTAGTSRALSPDMDNQERIEALIREAKDPLLQAVLLTMASLDHAVTASTRVLEQLAEDQREHRRDFLSHVRRFDQHILDEEKILAGVKWAWWAACGMGVGVLALGGLVVTVYASRIDADSVTLKIVQSRQAVNEAKISELERRQMEDDITLRRGPK